MRYEFPWKRGKNGQNPWGLLIRNHTILVKGCMAKSLTLHSIRPKLAKFKIIKVEIIHSVLSWIRRRVPRFVKNWLRSKRWRHPTPIYDIGESPPRGHLKVTDQPKRALLSSTTTPFRLSPDDWRNLIFSHIGTVRSIVHVLNELGYIVDIIERTDTKFIPRRHYDLFIGHGVCNFEHIARNLSPDTVKIYFSMGIYWKKWNRAEAERFRWLEERRGVHLPYDRWIYCSEEYAIQSADGIICKGNKVAKDSYAQSPVVINLNNASYHDNRYNWVKKDFAAGRNKFLFFSGSGNVHKGLDLLLEAFVQMDAHLYICQGIRPDFYEVYRHELKDFPNIHLIGITPLRSQLFYGLMDICNFVIHPTCAEGQPGSVIECMHHGLIPIVSREAHIDTDNYGITLNNCSIDEIVSVVRDLSQRSPEWCEEMSRRTRKAAVTEFSETVFLRNLRNAIQCMITRRAKQ